MKILFVSHSAVLEYHQQKLKIIADKGHDVTLVTPSYWYEGGVKTELFKGNTEIVYITGKVVMRKVNMMHFYLNAKDIVKCVKPDVVYIEEIPFHPVCYQFIKYAKRYKAKSIFYTWENMHRKLNQVYNYFYSYNINNADASIAGNQEGKTILEDLGFNKKIEVMPQYGININQFKKEVTPYPQSKEKFRVAFIGRVVPEKGVDLLLEAIANIENVEVFIAGTGDEQYIKSLKKLIDKTGIKEKVFFEGFVPREKIPDFLGRMHIMVLPSKTIHNWKEQFGRIIIEAFASSTVAVGSSSGEIPHVIGEGGLVFEEGNVEDLREKLLQVISEKTTYENYAEKGRLRSYEFTNEKIAEKLMDVIEEVVER